VRLAPGGNGIIDPIGAAGLNGTQVDFAARMDMEMLLRDVYDEANKNNVALYMVDPRGLAVGEFDVSDGNVDLQTDRNLLNQTMDTLRTLAVETDGRAIINRNDLVGGMKQIVSDVSAYYLIGYNSTQAPADGKFHEIKVRVKRPGVQVRSRKGYWALTPEVKQSSLPPKSPLPPAVSRRRERGERRRVVTQPVDSHLDWHGARRERQDESDVRLGAGTAATGRPAGVKRSAVARVPHGGGDGRLADFPRARA
jgi:hypothetical protein